MASEKTTKEIDALVAENWMGYRWMVNNQERVGETDDHKKMFPKGYLFLVPPSDFKSSYFKRAKGGEKRNEFRFKFMGHRYSENLEHAALMEREIAEKGQMNEYIEALSGTVSGVVFPDSYKDVWAIMQATPRQRCVAALSILGIEVK